MHYKQIKLPFIDNLGYLSKYPRLLLLFITFLVAYLLFYSNNYLPFHEFIASSSYIGVFIAGMLFVYSFTAAPATALLLILASEQNILLASLVGGFGALVGDLFIFTFIRYSFADELRKLSEEKIVRYFRERYFHGNMPGLLKKYLLPAVAGFIIASPLPDEIGVSLLAASKTMSAKIFSVISYSLNTVGIFAVLYVGTLL